jgi:hypothetical protein
MDFNQIFGIIEGTRARVKGKRALIEKLDFHRKTDKMSN